MLDILYMKDQITQGILYRNIKFSQTQKQYIFLNPESHLVDI